MKILITLCALTTAALARPGQVSSYGTQQSIPNASSHQSYETLGVPLGAQRFGVSPGVTKSQYHAQDELGQAAYGHSEQLQAHNAIQDAAGNKAGAYSYISPSGRQIDTHYIADHRGVRVSGNSLPVAPQPVKDTVEVSAARAAHLQVAAKAHTRDRRQYATFDAPLFAATHTTILNNPGHALSYRIDAIPRQYPQYLAPQFVAQQPSYIPQQPAFVAQHPTFIAQQPTFVAHEPAFVAQQPTFVGQHPTLIATQPTLIPQPGFIGQVPTFIGSPPTYLEPAPAHEVQPGGGSLGPDSIITDSTDAKFDSDTVAIEAARSGSGQNSDDDTVSVEAAFRTNEDQSSTVTQAPVESKESEATTQKNEATTKPTAMQQETPSSETVNQHNTPAGTFRSTGQQQQRQFFLQPILRRTQYVTQPIFRQTYLNEHGQSLAYV